jgi:hypothetical protein
MLLIRTALGMENVCIVNIFEHMIKAYLNSEIGINISLINNTNKFETYTIRKSSDLFSENYRGFGPIGFYFYVKKMQHG